MGERLPLRSQHPSPEGGACNVKPLRFIFEILVSS